MKAPRRTQLVVSAWLGLMASVACGGGSSTPTQPTTAPAAQGFGLSGRVTDSTSAAGVSGARVTIADGPNAGQSATADATGRYSFATLQRGGFTLTATADDYTSASTGVTLTSAQVVDLQIRRLYEGNWTAPAPATGSGGILSTINFTVRNGSIVSVAFVHALAVPGFVAACSFSATVSAPIVRGAFSIPINSRGLTSTFTGTFTSENGGRGTIGNFTLDRYQCSTGIFTGTVTAGGEFVFSRAS